MPIFLPRQCSSSWGAKWRTYSGRVVPPRPVVCCSLALRCLGSLGRTESWWWRTRAAGAGRGLCCRRNACRGDTGCPRGRTCQGGRRLDRLSVARLQHRAASEWGCDPLRRVWRGKFGLTGLAILPAGLVLWLHSGAGGRQAKRIDWLGLGLLAFFMVLLTSGLHALADVRSAPLIAIVPLVLAAITFCAVIWAERRHPRPLLDFALFGNSNFALGCALAFLLMFDIMALLLYYNLFAQSPDGLGMTAVAAGLSLAPLSVALFAVARAAHRLAPAIGLRTMMAAGSLLLIAGCTIAGASFADAGFVMLLLGLFAIGAGIALPYASAPHIALAALPPTQ